MKCRHDALTHMMQWGKKMFTRPILQSPLLTVRENMAFPYQTLEMQGRKSCDHKQLCVTLM